MLIGEELQRLYYATLSANSGIKALINRVYDHVPASPYGAKTAYISFGGEDYVDDGADCIDGLRVTTQIDVWSKAVGQSECKNIVELVRKALHEQELTLTDNAMVETRVVLMMVQPDPDEATTHGVVQVTATVEIP